MTLDKALNEHRSCREAYDSDDGDQVSDRYEQERLEGLPRHTSMHAAGVVISQKSRWTSTCLCPGRRTVSITTQFTMTTLEELGLLKMDFLGLRTLTVIQNAVNAGREEPAASTLDIEPDRL